MQLPASQQQSPVRSSHRSTGRGLRSKLGTSGHKSRARVNPNVQLDQLLKNESTRGSIAQEPSMTLLHSSISSMQVGGSSRSLVGGSSRSLMASSHHQRGGAPPPPPPLLGRPAKGGLLMDRDSGHSDSGHSVDYDARGPLNLYGRSRHGEPGMDDSHSSFFYDDHHDGEEFASGTFSVPPQQQQQQVQQQQVQQQQQSYAQAHSHGHEEHKTLEELTSNAADKKQHMNDSENYEMEISPGYYVPFRGANEVWKAVDNNNTLECICLECGIELVSVGDCEHVVCPEPECRMVNPVFEYPPGMTTQPYGAGLGFKKDWLIKEKRRRRSALCQV